MEIEEVLRRIGAEIVKTEQRPDSLRLWCRIPNRSIRAWAVGLKDFLGRAGKTWDADVSKSYFLKDGAIRFTWRVILSGDYAAGQAELVLALSPAQSESSMEVTSMPLVGRVEYVLDTARGKTKGAHNVLDAVPSLVIGGGS
jgi:hypothetical protein